MRERRLGTPAGTVPRRDDTRPDTIGEIVNGRLDPRLHARACQMIAAEAEPIWSGLGVPQFAQTHVVERG